VNFKTSSRELDKFDNNQATFLLGRQSVVRLSLKFIRTIDRALCVCNFNTTNNRSKETDKCVTRSRPVVAQCETQVKNGKRSCHFNFTVHMLKCNFLTRFAVSEIPCEKFCRGSLFCCSHSALRRKFALLSRHFLCAARKKQTVSRLQRKVLALLLFLFCDR